MKSISNLLTKSTHFYMAKFFDSIVKITLNESRKDMNYYDPISFSSLFPMLTPLAKVLCYHLFIRSRRHHLPLHYFPHSMPLPIEPLPPSPSFLSPSLAVSLKMWRIAPTLSIKRFLLLVIRLGSVEGSIGVR